MTKEALLGIAAARRYAQSGTGLVIRKRARLSQREVGAAVGTSGQSIGNWETGVSAPRGEAAIRWAELLDSLVEQERTAVAVAARIA